MGIWIQFLRRTRANARTVVRRRRLALLIVAMMLPMTFATEHVEGVYYSRADVLFLPPQALVGGNLLQADPTQTLSFAAMVEHKVNAEYPSTAPRTTSAPLYGTGAKNTHAVYIPSSGGQWQLSFSRPVITVEVVSDSSEGASRSLALLVTRIAELASLTQGAEGIPGTSRITTELSPAVPSVSYIDVRNSRATVTMILLTVGVASGVPILVERVQTVRRVSHRKAL